MNLTDALRRYFDKNSPMSKRVQYCGVALVGFDATFYPGEGGKTVADTVVEAARVALESWRTQIGQRLKAEKLDHVEIELFCLPLPSAESFRSSFLKAMGLPE